MLHSISLHCTAQNLSIYVNVRVRVRARRVTEIYVRARAVHEKSAIYFRIKSALYIYASRTEAITTAHFSVFDMLY